MIEKSDERFVMQPAPSVVHGIAVSGLGGRSLRCASHRRNLGMAREV